MALYDDFPYTNFHSLNLDWIVKKLSELENGESSEESSSTATLARNLSGNYPYTNFHSLNLDWIIRSMAGLESDFETLENEWQNLRATGLLNDEVKNAILQCFQNVAWANDQGQQYYNALRDLFFPPVVVSTLTAVLDQGERVFHTGEDVNVIKDYLTVTAKLTDGTLITVPATQYVLTGSLSQEGPNIIIVTYMNTSTTITVNAVAVSLVSISAVYTQSGTVYDTDSLDSLKSDLVVTATYDDSSTATVPSADYTLSGTLTVGTSTITVAYGGKTTTFNVTVTAETFIYKLSNPTVFDGTNYINTGIQFMKTDISFTVMMKFVNGNNSGDTRATLIHCKNEIGPYQGFAIRKNDNLYAFDGQTTSALTLSSYAATENFEIVLVIRHTAGETDYFIDGSVNGIRMGQVTATRGKDPYLTDKPLVIGASLGNDLTSYSRYWIGTLNDFRIKDAVMTDSAVTSYIDS